MRSIIVFMLMSLLMLTPPTAARTYCDGSNEIEQIGIGNNTLTIDRGHCDYGCYNVTIKNLGGPGCRATDLELLIFFAAIIVAVAILIRVCSK